jgi:hypothetical protein
VLTNRDIFAFHLEYLLNITKELSKNTPASKNKKTQTPTLQKYIEPQTSRTKQNWGAGG